ncbi:MAG: hypothetical protein AABX23_01750 [Nanoarchaeota archaeon]
MVKKEYSQEGHLWDLISSLVLIIAFALVSISEYIEERIFSAIAFAVISIIYLVHFIIINKNRKS